jgi:hypothetical protein
MRRAAADIASRWAPSSISAWQSIPNDPSDYSHDWDSRESFKPQQFAENTRVASAWRDVGRALAFLLNLVAIAAVFYFAWRAGGPKELRAR